MEKIGFETSYVNMGEIFSDEHLIINQLNILISSKSQNLLTHYK